jgi:hypothetical protein
VGDRAGEPTGGQHEPRLAAHFRRREPIRVAARAGVEARQRERDLLLAGAVLRPIRQRHPRAGRQHADQRRELVRAADLGPVEPEQLVAELHAELAGDRVGERRLHEDPAMVAARRGHVPRIQIDGSVLGVPARHQIPEEVADLVARDREPDPGVDPPAVAHRDPAVDPDDATMRSNSGPPELPGLTGASTWMQSG